MERCTRPSAAWNDPGTETLLRDLVTLHVVTMEHIDTQHSENRYDSDMSMGMVTNREIELAPGQYEIQAVLSDGEKFGRQKMPLVENSR